MTLNSLHVTGLIFAALAFAGCSPKPSLVAQEQTKDRVELSTAQPEEDAALERKHAEERGSMSADQGRQNADMDMKSEKADASVHADQVKYHIDAQEQVSKIDARIAELRRLGRVVDVATINARDAMVVHMKECDDEVMSRETWTKHRDMMNREMTVLTNQVSRAEDAKR
jgi:hypothetical protein